MKLRMLGDSLRLRLTMSETLKIGKGQSVSATTTFPDGSKFGYVLSVEGEGVRAGVALHTGQGMQQGLHQLSVTVPKHLALRWSESTDVALGGDEPINVDGLQVLIEKDFDCVSPRAGEKDVDTFPNPSLTNC
jgi:hypothetical protein